MEYLKAAISLLSLIKETNNVLLSNIDKLAKSPNYMYFKTSDNNTKEVQMVSFSNEFVNIALEDTPQSQAFVMTDIATMDVKGKKLTYILYKGYHCEIEKGMVFYQVINKETFAPIESLQFSNIEENIFYQVITPEKEESSCNAMETDKEIKGGKSIVFFIGHMDEERLIYDIQRLIFDTANNVKKHNKLQFEFIINISRFGGTPSQHLIEQVKSIEEFTQNSIYQEYPNAKFKFEFEKEEN
ncbi:hypothetical protein [Carboxylicivirga linearis]|uniref:Uncharacterized protein n=1 Tax=Carboxylicivirga linearis TaxID=1628157 RepID=A0ABS5JW01_9BACT|nr:hypothetical protein [Carboxylicivirga linearis]MBS2099019.1 hypothetical protein [Carboxylicivirga linearis]